MCRPKHVEWTCREINFTAHCRICWLFHRIEESMYCMYQNRSEGNCIVYNFNPTGKREIIVFVLLLLERFIRWYRRSSLLAMASGPGQLSRYSDSLQCGRSGDRIPVGARFFRTRPERPWGPPSLLYNGYRVFPGGKSAGALR